MKYFRFSLILRYKCGSVYAIMEIIKSIRGGCNLCNNGYCYTKKKTTKTTVRWECSKKRSVQCHGSVTTDLAVSIAFCPVNAKKLL